MRSPSLDIAEYLEEQGVGTFPNDTKWSINVGQEPKTPDDCITIYDTGGGESFPEDELYEPHIQVRVRSKSYNEGYLKQREIMDILILPTARDLGEDDDTHYIGIWATNDVLPIGRDDNKRSILTSNYRINRQPNEEATT